MKSERAPSEAAKTQIQIAEFVYVVIGNGGGPNVEDNYNWHVAAYLDENSAKIRAKNAQERAEEIEPLVKRLSLSEIIERGYTNEFDESMPLVIRNPTYDVEEIPLILTLDSGGG